jgi:hypothetical protein
MVKEQGDDDVELISSNSGRVPVPDPTILTTAALLREIAALKESTNIRVNGIEQRMVEMVSGAIKALEGVIITRLEGMDRALELLQSTADKFPQRIDEKIGSLGKVHEEKFHSIQTQFTERDVRTEQTSRDSKVAVDAALQAAKEAVGEQNRSSALAIAKSEAATSKQIDQMGSLIQQNTNTSNDKIQDLKDRLTRLEGTGQGTQQESSRGKTATRDMIGVMGFILALLIGIGTIILSIARSRGGP